jgi:ABC-type lipoprotein release transport system permease subunit
MITFIKIAWRNILRNRARSFITIAAVAAGLCALIFLKSFVDGADHQMIANYTDLLAGHIQIHKAGFQKNMGLDKSINNEESIAAVLRKTPYVAAFAPRIKEFALISSSESSAGILLLGIDPAREQGVTTLHRKIQTGTFLSGADNDAILIGRQLADNLKVTVGDKVVVMGQAFDGSIAAAAYTVCGLLDAGAEELDKSMAFITLRAAQHLFVMENRISEIAVKTRNLDEIEAATQDLRGRCNRTTFEVLNWKEISPMIYQWLQFDQVFTGLFLFIVLLVVAGGILNTILMGVLERTKEFGIMLALGTKPSQIIFMVGAESLFLGLIGAGLGTLAGAGLVLLSGHTGIDLSSVSEALNDSYIGSMVYPLLRPVSVAVYAGIVLLLSIAVSVFPAVKASRLSPIEAIRS